MQKRKCKEKEKLKSLGDVTPEEWRKAMKVASYWLTDELEGHTDRGAFSVAYLGDEARRYFTLRAFNTLRDPNCKWKWKEDVKLSTLIINVMRSDMGHVLRDYINDGKPDVKLNSEFERPDEDGDFDDFNEVVEINPDDRHAGYQVQSELEMLEELQREESMRDKGRRAARAAARETCDPKLVRYVELVFELPDYRTISKRMKITQAEVLELESRLIEIFSAK